MTSGIVTVSAGGSFALRSEIAGSQKNIELDTFYSYDGEEGAAIANHFLNELGEKSALLISGMAQFNKKNKFERHNLEMVHKFLRTFPDRARELTISDPEKEIEETLAISELSFDIEGYIRKNSSNEVLLAKLYRRIIGQVKGIPAKSVIVTLITLAKEDPNKFLINGRKIYEDKSFEMFSLIDLCVERGIMTVDTDGSIRDKDRRILATDIEKMAFYLEGDELERNTYMRLVDDSPVKSLRYEQMPEISSRVILNETETGLAATNAFGVMTPEMIRADIANTFQLFKDAQFVVQTGQGPTTRYSLYDVPGSLMKKDELIKFFETNPDKYQDYKQRASI